MTRLATPEDVSRIVELIHELAVFEGAPNGAAVTVTSLTNVLFGEEPFVFSHVVEDDGEVVGFALWYRTFSTWTGRAGIEIQDLYISPSFRSRGHGRELLAQLAQICVDRDYARLQWDVAGWNSNAIAFYQSIGAETVEGWQGNELKGDELRALALSKRI